MEIRAGTSGFSYKAWKGSFYPEDLPNDGMLAYYGEQLPAVEINNTFYRLPKASVLEGWGGKVPAEFRFSIKASRRITHFKRLKNPAEETGYLIETLGVLGPRLGALLFQLPPNFKKDIERLRDFLALVPDGTPSTFEFRNASWFDDETYQTLTDHGCALCVADTGGEADPPRVATTGRGYLRLRREEYSDAELADWHRWVTDQAWSDALVFFKHEDAGAGPALAKRFLALGD